MAEQLNMGNDAFEGQEAVVGRAGAGQEATAAPRFSVDAEGAPVEQPAGDSEVQLADDPAAQVAAELAEMRQRSAVELIEQNPGLKAPLLTVLSLCTEGQDVDRAALEEYAAHNWSEGYRLDPAACINTLVRNGALEERLFVDGQLYEGTMEDLQFDESVSEDAEAVLCVNITESGREALAAFEPANTLAALFAQKPAYEDVFLAVLRTCNTAEGCALPDLEAVINQFPQLAPDAQSGQTKVYPQFFIDALETAGGIAWDGKWRTTQAGKDLVA